MMNAVRAARQPHPAMILDAAVGRPRCVKRLHKNEEEGCDTAAQHQGRAGRPAAWIRKPRACQGSVGHLLQRPRRLPARAANVPASRHSSARGALHIQAAWTRPLSLHTWVAALVRYGPTTYAPLPAVCCEQEYASDQALYTFLGRWAACMPTPAAERDAAENEMSAVLHQLAGWLGQPEAHGRRRVLAMACQLLHGLPRDAALQTDTMDFLASCCATLLEDRDTTCRKLAAKCLQRMMYIPEVRACRAHTQPHARMGGASGCTPPARACAALRASTSPWKR